MLDGMPTSFLSFRERLISFARRSAQRWRTPSGSPSFVSCIVAVTRVPAFPEHLPNVSLPRPVINSLLIDGSSDEYPRGCVAYFGGKAPALLPTNRCVG